MTPLLLLLLLPGAAEAQDKQTTRYFRESEGALALESFITETRTDKGTVYVSLTDRGKEKMTLTLRFDRGGKLTSAETLIEGTDLKGKKAKASAELTLKGGSYLLRRPGNITEFYTLPPDVVVTTAPDWSDIIQVLRRYDRKKGGKQEFAGFWFHPIQPPRKLTFTVEKLGDVTAGVNGEKHTLGKYRVELRSGAYFVWAEADGRVVKLMPSGNAKAAVYLEGFHEVTKRLK
jgi:hypothetical protein